MAAQGMDRIMVFDRLDGYLCDINPQSVRSLPYVEEINGEHSLTITTTQALEKTNRVLVRDAMGIWHEYVVMGAAETHQSKAGTEAEYYCIWSLQYDAMCTFVNSPYGAGVVPGHASVPVSARTALEVSLSGTSRWGIGTVTVTTMASASFYRRSGWEALQTVIEQWGGELQATITVDSHGVVSRSIDLLAHVGSSTAKRRFDFGHDVANIKRTFCDDVWPCRIIPLGKAQETENGGYSRRPSIESVNGGVLWVQDDEVVPYVSTMDANGELEYPTIIVQNDTYEDPADLLAWALEHKTDYTRPRVTYESDVIQFVKAGLNAHGVELGENVIVVDKAFGVNPFTDIEVVATSAGLRINARVMRIEGDLLDATKTKLTIGNLADSLGSRLAGVSKRMGQLEEMIGSSQQYQATAEYVANLISRINAEINATGGYTYLVPGIGAVTYDVAVSDPTGGDEASQATEMRGGTLRFANTRTASGDWDWTNVITADGYLALAATIARLEAGYISNADGSFYVDLDGQTVNIGHNPIMGDAALQDILDDARRQATDFIHIEGGEVTFGTADGAIRNVVSATRQAFRTDAGDVSWYGKAEEEDIWKLFVQNAQITDMLQFGGFAWIARDNGNMTVKWVGE